VLLSVVGVVSLALIALFLTFIALHIRGIARGAGQLANDVAALSRHVDRLGEQATVRNSMIVLAELLADALDYDLMTAALMPNVPFFQSWHYWPRHLLTSCPILGEILDANPRWWPGLAELRQAMAVPVQAQHPLLQDSTGHPSR